MSGFYMAMLSFLNTLSLHEVSTDLGFAVPKVARLVCYVLSDSGLALAFINWNLERSHASPGRSTWGW